MHKDLEHLELLMEVEMDYGAKIVCLLQITIGILGGMEIWVKNDI